MITLSVIAVVIVLILIDELRRSRKSELRRQHGFKADARSACGHQCTTGRTL